MAVRKTSHLWIHVGLIAFTHRPIAKGPGTRESLLPAVTGPGAIPPGCKPRKGDPETTLHGRIVPA
mgnify:CR=1 FL=1